MPEEASYRNFKCAISSFVANYIAGILHPFDVIKTRFQSHDGKARTQNIVPKYGGILKAFKDIHKDQGVKGLFKGFYMSLLTNALASSFFFWLYEQRKEVYLNSNWTQMQSVSLASLEAGIIATIVTQPFWVIKTRMLLNIDPNVSQLSNFITKTKQIYQHYGMKGYLKGLSVNLVLASMGVTQMYMYQGSKMLYDKLQIPHTKYSQKNFICGGISKVASGLIMYPLTTIRTRIQQTQYINNNDKVQKYKGISDITLRTWKQEGIYGFYKGLGSNIIKGIPQKGIYFYFYQLIKSQCFNIKQHKAY